jgi:hypothetical protein
MAGSEIIFRIFESTNVMTDNELKLYVVLLVFALLVWSIYFMRRNGLLASGKIYEKAEFAWKIYREASSADEKLVAACIAFFVMTHSLIKAIFGLLMVVVTVTIGGVFNNTVWQFLIDLVRDVVKPLIPAQHGSHVP